MIITSLEHGGGLARRGSKISSQLIAISRFKKRGGVKRRVSINPVFVLLERKLHCFLKRFNLCLRILEGME